MDPRDLGAGIPLAEMPEDVPIEGRVGETLVLLVRRGREVHAVGSQCTHYGGPLAEGIVSGDTVSCPWHHARFHLRTGEAERAPALVPLPCYRVEIRDGRAFVHGKAEPSQPVAKATQRHPRSVVVVGAGAAGNAAAETLRREGYQGVLTLVGAEPSLPYDRPNLSKDYLAGTAPEEFIPLHAESFYADQSIDLVLGQGAARIDLAARSVVGTKGSTWSYDALILATGADPVVLGIPGAALPHVHVLRSLADSRAIIARAGVSKRAVVIGAGFIGLEAAAALRTRGLDVHVIAPDRAPLERVMGPDLSSVVRAAHETRGVVFHLGRTAVRIDEKAVGFADGTSIDADLVLIGVGVRPSVALAETAPLVLDRGIAVDDQLRTSAPGIWAAGDAVRWPSKRYGQMLRIEHWATAERQGKAAARNVLGAGESFDPVPFFWSNHFDVAIAYVGHASNWDRLDVAGSPDEHDCAVAFRRAGRTLAVATIGRDRTSLEAESALEKGDEDRLAALVPPR
jgi:NADPH-dependent 2,4-dienoyl-CoA reductase/sulfur reductase-like enzyme/nitrite reductase/ring-hydroxylating ferredoxin subunit